MRGLARPARAPQQTSRNRRPHRSISCSRDQTRPQAEDRMTEGMKRLALCSAALLALGACVSAPTTTQLATALRSDELGLRGAPVPAIGTSWWNAFGDPQLDRLVGRAFEG